MNLRSHVGLREAGVQQHRKQTGTPDRAIAMPIKELMVSLQSGTTTRKMVQRQKTIGQIILSCESEGENMTGLTSHSANVLVWFYLRKRNKYWTYHKYRIKHHKSCNYRKMLSSGAVCSLKVPYNCTSQSVLSLLRPQQFPNDFSFLNYELSTVYSFI